MALFDTRIGEGQILYVFPAKGLLTGKKDLAALRLRQHFLILGFLEEANKKNHYQVRHFLSLPAEFFLLVNIIAKHSFHFHEDNQK